MNSNSIPLIAITCGTDDKFPRGREFYTKALNKAGAEGFFLSPQSCLRDLVRRYDGFIIPGGRDLDPSFYGEGGVCRIVAEDRARSDFEFSLMGEIIKLKKPVFGICYGMQLINVFFKGSLFQDIKFQLPGCLDHEAGFHWVTIGNNPFIDACNSEVNSSHHQAVRRLGRGLKSFGHSSDGIIEAFYAEGFRFLSGVQWHPERMQDPMSAQLFEMFVGACRV